MAISAARSVLHEVVHVVGVAVVRKTYCVEASCAATGVAALERDLFGVFVLSADRDVATALLDIFLLGVTLGISTRKLLGHPLVHIRIVERGRGSVTLHFSGVAAVTGARAGQTRGRLLRPQRGTEKVLNLRLVKVVFWRELFICLFGCVAGHCFVELFAQSFVGRPLDR